MKSATRELTFMKKRSFGETKAKQHLLNEAKHLSNSKSVNWPSHSFYLSIFSQDISLPFFSQSKKSIQLFLPFFYYFRAKRFSKKQPRRKEMTLIHCTRFHSAKVSLINQLIISEAIITKKKRKMWNNGLFKSEFQYQSERLCIYQLKMQK